MVDQIDLNIELGPLFTVQVSHSPDAGIVNVDAPFTVSIDEPVEQTFTLIAGVNSSSNYQQVVSDDGVHFLITAAQPISLYRAITFSGVYCEPTSESLSQYAGVSRVAGVIGDTVKATKSGLIYEAGWTWIPNTPIFIGVNGVLTQSLGSVPVRRIGWAISATQIALDPFPIIGA